MTGLLFLALRIRGLALGMINVMSIGNVEMIYMLGLAAAVIGVVIIDAVAIGVIKVPSRTSGSPLSINVRHTRISFYF